MSQENHKQPDYRHVISEVLDFLLVGYIKVLQFHSNIRTLVSSGKKRHFSWCFKRHSNLKKGTLNPHEIYKPIYDEGVDFFLLFVVRILKIILIV